LYKQCPNIGACLATTANVTPKTTNSNYLLPNTASNDIQQHVNSANSGDVDIRNLTVTLIRTIVLQRSSSDARVFSSMQNEQTYPWLYDSVVHQGYLCKFCELFCGHCSSSQEFVTVGINLGTVWLLFYYWTSKLINLLLFPSFPNSHQDDGRNQSENY
jgi:hypothetical protein